MPTRYYFHGDELEEAPGQYHCGYCDLAVSKEHFAETKHSGTDKERYDRSVKGWKILQENTQWRLVRPKNAKNLFSHLPAPKKPKTSPFYRWLMQQDGRDDPIGDMALDVQRDRNFPSDSGSLDILTGYLVRKLAHAEAIQALEEAHAEFKSGTKVRSGLSLSLRFDIFRRDEYRCQICGFSTADGAKLEVDHKVPVVKGGSDETSNLWILCFRCNRGKGAKDL